MSDDFLVQVRRAEDDAKNLVEKAKKKAQEDLQKEHQKLEEGRKETLEKAREKAKKELAESQQHFRGEYDERIQEGKKTALSLEKEAHSRIEKAIPVALSFLLHDLI